MSGKMIQWTTEADEAFQRMKELLEALPTVTSPVNGKTLIVYLAAFEESIRAVLMAERGEKQVPMYFISRTFHGAELEYPGLEKLILALVYASRKLRRYFQAHPIQILAAFLAETPPKKEIKNRETKRKEPESKNAWKLFTDGASSSDGSGEGLMLVDLEGKEYTYALRFEFETTNNEAKYEALLARLRIAKEMKIQELIIFVDSQLVANQVNGLFEARQPVRKQYLEKAKELLVSFPTYSIEHIKRDQNKKADVLNKLYSMTLSKLAKEVLVEVLQEKKTPDDPQRARKLRVKAPLYKLMDGTLYQRSYLSPWLRTITNNTRRRKVPSSGHRLLHKIGRSKAANINDREAHGKVEVTNREVVKGMARRLGKTHQGWVDELPQVLWAHKTTLKSSNGETSFSLVYGSEAVIPIEISVETRRI
ncbi:reverse transcriptase domain-containing protein [Tanacetum coccineum]